MQTNEVWIVTRESGSDFDMDYRYSVIGVYADKNAAMLGVEARRGVSASGWSVARYYGQVVSDYTYEHERVEGGDLVMYTIRRHEVLTALANNKHGSENHAD